MADLSSVLHFNPKWWIDPPPPWLFEQMREQMRPEVIRELAVIQLGLEKTVIEAQLNAIDKTMGLIRQMK